MIWLVFAVLTGLSLLAVLLPLARAGAPAEAAETDRAFYREQLAEIAREREEGRLAPEDAEIARTEAARRLLRASENQGTVPKSTRRARLAAALGTLILAPALAIPLYLFVGADVLPDMPLARRKAVAPPQADLAAAVAKVEEHLAEHPDDGRGWEVLAPVYMRAGRYEEGAQALSEALRLLGPTPARYAALGEARVFAAEGEVTPAAQREFEAALKLDPADLVSRYYLGLAAAQEGDEDKAREIWAKLLAEAPANAPYRALVQGQIGKLRGAAPAGSAAKAVAAAPPPDQQAMIAAMVERLAARLAQNGDDVEGWLKLLRAYSVMAEKDKALTALADARNALRDKPTELARVEALASELGIGKEGAP